MKPKLPSLRNFAVIITALAVSLAASVKTFAVEGLQLSVQCSDVVLSWPSVPGKNYIVQYRQSLDPSTPWQTLASSYPADWSANVTVFVHANVIQYPNCGGTTGSSSLAAMSRTASDIAVSMPPVPMAMKADGTGSAVPLTLFPPGFDLSTFMILDPSTGERVSGAGFTRQTTTLANSGVPAPVDGGSGGGTNSVLPPETGFYRVVQDGVQIANSSLMTLTNSALSNIVNIQFEAGYADPSNGTNVLGILNSAVVVVDGVEFAGDGVLSTPAGYPWQFAMDTGYLENGSHTIWLEVTWQNTNNTDNNNPFFTRYSDAVTITVTNDIYYPQWEPEIGELNISAYFAKTTCRVCDWTIDIYSASSNLVKTLTGHTTNGTITAYWNMKDKNGIARTNAAVDPYFDSVITVSDPATKKAPRKNQRRKDWPDHGVWTIAYQDFFKFEYDDQNYMKGSLNSFAATAQTHGGYLLYYPQPGQTNDIGQTYPIRFQKDNHPDPTITSDAIAKDHALFLSFLTNTACRNLYLSSHGSPTTVAGGFPASDVQKYAKQRYRFVFLDGCDTANGGWDKAFGINGPGQFDITYYQNTGIRPATFLGYNQHTYYTVGGPVRKNGVLYDDTIAWQAGGFIINFLFYWDTGGNDVSYAIRNAKRNLPPIGSWYPGDGLQIFGYPNLHVDDYNHKTDWQ